MCPMMVGCWVTGERVTLTALCDKGDGGVKITVLFLPFTVIMFFPGTHGRRIEVSLLPRMIDWCGGILPPLSIHERRFRPTKPRKN